MNPPPQPLVDARISAELKQLLADLRLQRQRAERGATEPADDGSRQARQDRTPTATLPWKQFSLRRDGARPARFSGALILEVRSAHHPEHGCLRLFATADGEAVAQIAYLPPASLPARPVYRAARVTSAEALHRFIDDAAPALCLAVCPDMRAPPAHCTTCDMLRLPIDLPGLAAPESLSPQLQEGMQS